MWIEGGRGKRGEEEKREVDGGKPEARDGTTGGKTKGDGDSATEAVPVLLPSALSRAHKKSYANVSNRASVNALMFLCSLHAF